MQLNPQYIVRTAGDLEALYEQALERSIRKQMDHLDAHSRAFIAASPLVILSTQGSGPDGMADNSPRGDVPGFVRAADDRTLLIPDRRGNNRLDSLRNIIANPKVALLFLVPGRNETFRVNGLAEISTDPALLAEFAVQGKPPRSILVVHVKEAYIHCSRALLRAALWDSAKLPPACALPSFGTIMAAHTQGFVDAQALDEENKTRIPATLY